MNTENAPKSEIAGNFHADPVQRFVAAYFIFVASSLMHDNEQFIAITFNKSVHTVPLATHHNISYGDAPSTNFPIFKSIAWSNKTGTAHAQNCQRRNEFFIHFFHIMSLSEKCMLLISGIVLNDKYIFISLFAATINIRIFAFLD